MLTFLDTLASASKADSRDITAGEMRSFPRDGRRLSEQLSPPRTASEPPAPSSGRPDPGPEFALRAGMPAAPEGPKPRRSRRWLHALLGAAVVALVAFGLWPRAEGQSKRGGKGGKGEGDRVVPVLAAEVDKRD